MKKKKLDAKAAVAMTKKHVAKLKKEAIGVERKVVAYVKKNPKKAVAIAAGVAAAIAAIIALKRRKR